MSKDAKSFEDRQEEILSDYREEIAIAERTDSKTVKRGLVKVADDRMKFRMSELKAEMRKTEQTKEAGFLAGRGAWTKRLRMTKTKGGVGIQENAMNLGIIFSMSEEFAGKLEYDELCHEVVINDPIKLAIATGEVRILGSEGKLGRRRFTAADLHPLAQFLEYTYHMPKVPIGDIEAAINDAAMTRGFHPVQEYLAKCYLAHGASMSQQEAEDVVYGFLERSLGAKDFVLNEVTGESEECPEVTRAKSRVLFISAVARVLPASLDRYGIKYRRSDAAIEHYTFGPGCLVKQMVALYGKSNLRKSFIIQALSPHHSLVSEEQIEFSDVKAATEVLIGKWLAEYPEFDQALYGRASESQCKAFVSKRKDKVRLAYERQAKEYPRQFILIGTMNTPQILNDVTTRGEVSRFLVVDCGNGWDQNAAVGVAAISRERDRVWGAAVKLYAFPDEGHDPAIWWIDRQSHPDVVQKLVQGQAAYEDTLPVEDKLTMWLRKPTFPLDPDWPDPNFIAVSVLRNNALAVHTPGGWGQPPQHISSKVLNQVLTRHKWTCTVVRASPMHAPWTDSGTIRGWLRPGHKAATTPLIGPASPGAKDAPPPGDSVF